MLFASSWVPGLILPSQRTALPNDLSVILNLVPSLLGFQYGGGSGRHFESEKTLGTRLSYTLFVFYSLYFYLFVTRLVTVMIRSTLVSSSKRQTTPFVQVPVSYD